MGTNEDGSGQAGQPDFDPASPWRPPDQVPVERSPGWYGRIAVLSSVTAAIWIWLTIMGAWRGESWPILLPSGGATVLFVVIAGRWVTRWRRHREWQPD